MESDVPRSPKLCFTSGLGGLVVKRSLACAPFALLLVLAVTPARAQQAAGILDDPVDILLRDWAQKTSQINSLYAEFTRTTVDNVWGTKESAKGSARYLAPQKARLDILGENAESYVITGEGEIWEYKPPMKQITVYELPPEMVKQAMAVQDGPLPFLFGTEPEKAKARYRFQIIQRDDKIINVKVFPKLEEDKQHFVWADLRLDGKSFLPTKLVFQEVNGNIVTFDFGEQVWTNIEINAEDFVGKQIKDWRIVRKRVEQDASGEAQMSQQQSGQTAPR